MKKRWHAPQAGAIGFVLAVAISLPTSAHDTAPVSDEAASCMAKLAPLHLSTGEGTLYHAGHGQRATSLRSQTRAMQDYLDAQLGVRPELTLIVADAQDWKTGCMADDPYGLPFNIRDGARGSAVFMAADADNEASRAYAAIEPAVAPDLRARIAQGRSFAAAAQGFTDLIGLHEVGHVYSDTYGIRPKSRWLDEFLATYLAYAYLHARQPGDARLWRDMNLAFSSGSAPHASLDDFDRLYVDVGAQNYGWYQGHFARKAADVFERRGIGFIGEIKAAGLRNETSQAALLRKLDALDPGFGAWAEQLGKLAAVPDQVLLNGDVFTANPAQPHAQALAIIGERIVAVGTSEEIAALADAHTRRIDLKGHRVVPGINDAHEHLGFVPADDTDLEGDSPYDPSWESLRAAIIAAVAKSPRGGFLEGSIGGKVFYDPKIDRSLLDTVAPQRPVMLTTFDGHAVILNSPALAALGIGENSVDPLGGRFERDGRGRLTGVAREYAADIVWRAQGKLVADADALAQLRRQLQKRAKLGITTTQTMPVMSDAARFAGLLQQLSPPIRVRVTPFETTTAAGRSPDSLAALTPQPAPLIAVNGTKWVIDGVLFEGSLTPRDRAAHELDSAQGPYSPIGLPMLFEQKELRAILRESLRDGRQLQVHVFGYPAAKAMLDAMDATGGASVWANRRVRFEHGDGLLADLLPRVKALGVVVSQQPSHLDLPDIDARFAERVRAAKAQPLRALLDAGIPLALGSDGPVTSPWINLMFAATHPSRPDQAITREQALMAYTLGSAYAEFTEKDKGSLEPGKLADLAVLSQDVLSVPLEKLPETTSLLTMVGGRTAYASEEFKTQSAQP